MTLTLPPAERTLPVLLTRQAQAHPDKVLVRFDDVDWTYRDTVAIAGRAAHSLRHDYGVGPSDTVVLVSHNRPEFLEIVLGAAWLGAISAPLNVAAKGEQLRHMLDNAGPRVIFVEPTLVQRVRDEAPHPGTHIVVLGDEDVAGADGRWRLPSPSRELPAAPVGPGDPLVILYTSGTTGVSKGVLGPHAQYYWWARHNIELLEIVPDDILLTTLPMFHTNAFNAFFQALTAGATIVYKRRFSASGFRAAIEQSEATVTYLLGAMVPIVLTTPERADDAGTTLDRVLAGGVPGEVAERFARRFGVRLTDGFASTESNFVIGSRPHERRAGWMGTVRPGFHARVVDENDAELPDGTPGELLLRADHPYAFALGYHRMPEATVNAWRNLWLHTGDRVVRDGDGYFRFLDRIKDAIRRRGENISSFEVERAFLRHESVDDVAVFAVASDLAEDEVMAAVVLKSGAATTPEELLEHAQQHLAYFAVPRFIDFLSELPLTENGKVRKVVLRERGVSSSTWDREASGYEVSRDA